MRLATTISLLALVLPFGSAVFAQSVQVDEPTICYQCHGEMEDLANERHVHAAFADGQCSNCHNPHATRHATLLNDELKELCLECHTDVERELALDTAHGPAANGRCGTCHDPHASSHRAQLVQSSPDLCEGCHRQVIEWSARRVVHAPVGDGDCAACHSAHGSDNASLLGSAVPALCFDCHSQDQSFRQVHQGRDLSGSNCGACHDPHASGLNGLLRENQHGPFASGQCNSCHAEAGGSAGFAVSAVRELCTECHRGVEDWVQQAFHHNLDDEGSCQNCHEPHASNAGHLLKQRQSVMCMSCHFNDIGPRDKTEFVTHAGMECSTCHTPHGSANAKLLSTMDVDLCAPCHEAAHKVSHPVGPDVIDPRTEQPVTCVSCHRMHGSEFEDYLPLDPQMELCIQCHRR